MLIIDQSHHEVKSEKYRYFIFNSVFNCPGAETTTLEITHKLKISATTLCDERNKYILAQALLSVSIARNQGHFEPTNNIVNCMDRD